ncbi:MAG: cellulase family glycosylhydrolase [Planctomycetaceae bacterium]
MRPLARLLHPAAFLCAHLPHAGAALFAIVLMTARPLSAEPPEPVRVSDDGTHFVRGSAGERFVVWGVNYDHDHSGRLLDEYWVDEWETVVEDFREIKELGANCVRVHLQFGKFMDSPQQPNRAALAQLAKLVTLAEQTGLYLDITGLACYHRKNIPEWYDDLSEEDRWTAQARFWESVAEVCKSSPAIFCYDLMNEPILPGEPSTDWLTGELAGKFFVQRLSLDLNGRSREEVAEKWVNLMVDAIRRHDERHMVTVGVIPWVFVFGGGKPLFHSPSVGRRLDFVAVHFYPKSGEIEKALTALKAYETGKPVLIEEMFPLKCSIDELAEFIDQSSTHVDGWISFYWGATASELTSKPNASLGEAITAKWLEKFAELATPKQVA